MHERRGAHDLQALVPRSRLRVDLHQGAESEGVDDRHVGQVKLHRVVNRQRAKNHCAKAARFPVEDNGTATLEDHRRLWSVWKHLSLGNKVVFHIATLPEAHYSPIA